MPTPLTTAGEVVTAEAATVTPIADLLAATQQLVNFTVPPEDLPTLSGYSLTLNKIRAIYEPFLAIIRGLGAAIHALALELEALLPDVPVLNSISPTTLTQGATAVSFDLDVANIPSDWELVLAGLSGVTLVDSTLASPTSITGHFNVSGSATIETGSIYIHSPSKGDSAALALSVVASGPGVESGLLFLMLPGL
jgi:hypothetical protein